MTTVGPATQADVDALVAQWVALVEDQRSHGTHLLGEPNRNVARDVISQYVVADDLLVARDGDAIVGFVMFHVESGLYEQDATRGILDNVYVVPAAREQGIGSRLLAAAEETLGDRGADLVALSVMAENHRAREFYAARGYGQQRLLLEKPTESDSQTRTDG